MASSTRDRLQPLASDTFTLSGDVHRLITFLNQSLKHKGYIFGLKRFESGEYGITLYATGEGQHTESTPSPPV